MKICIPTKLPKGFEAPVYNHFGSAPYFLIYHDEKFSIEVVQNQNSHHQHGACNPIASIADKNVNAVICGGMGANALRNLQRNGIKVFLSNEQTVGSTIEKFKAGELQEMEVEHSCQEHGCH